jgi:hypothetical protein
VGAETHFMRLADPGGARALGAAFALRTTLGLGKYF